MNTYTDLSNAYTAGIGTTYDDQTFDEFENIINIANGNVVDQRSVDVVKGGKTCLPKQLESQTKFKTEKDFNRFIKDDAVYSVSAKMDGITMLLHEDKAYTRGDGKRGQDISWLKRAMKLADPPSGVMVRGELMISKADWDNTLAKHTGITNLLSFVAGFANSKSPDMSLVHHFRFVGFQWVSELDDVEDSPSTQFASIEDAGYDVVDSEIYDDLEWSGMQDILDTFRNRSDYVLDGIVITEDIKHQRVDDTNPPYSRAFKDSVIISSIVEYVEWNITKYGTLAPLIYYNSVSVDGKTYC
jgi:NAD-dependent DNA ligase